MVDYHISNWPLCTTDGRLSYFKLTVVYYQWLQINESKIEINIQNNNYPIFFIIKTKIEPIQRKEKWVNISVGQLLNYEYIAPS